MLCRMWTVCEVLSLGKTWVRCPGLDPSDMLPPLCTVHVKSAPCTVTNSFKTFLLLAVYVSTRDNLKNSNPGQFCGGKKEWGVEYAKKWLVWEFIPVVCEIGHVRNADGLRKIYNCLALARASLAEGLESINLIFSKSLTCRPSCPYKSLLRPL